MSEAFVALQSDLVSDWLSLAAIAPLLLLYSRAQTMVNRACGDPDGIGNRKLSAAN